MFGDIMKSQFMRGENSSMKKIRTIEQMHKDLLEDDPQCALTKTALRRLVVTGAIPSTKVGQKYLISREAVEKFMEAAG